MAKDCVWSPRFGEQENLGMWTQRCRVSGLVNHLCPMPRMTMTQPEGLEQGLVSSATHPLKMPPCRRSPCTKGGRYPTAFVTNREGRRGSQRRNAAFCIENSPPGCAPWTLAAVECMVLESHPTALSRGWVEAAQLPADGKALINLRSAWEELE